MFQQHFCMLQPHLLNSAGKVAALNTANKACVPNPNSALSRLAALNTASSSMTTSSPPTSLPRHPPGICALCPEVSPRVHSVRSLCPNLLLLSSLSFTGLPCLEAIHDALPLRCLRFCPHLPSARAHPCPSQNNGDLSVVHHPTPRGRETFSATALVCVLELVFTFQYDYATLHSWTTHEGCVALPSLPYACPARSVVLTSELAWLRGETGVGHPGLYAFVRLQWRVIMCAYVCVCWLARLRIDARPFKLFCMCPRCLPACLSHPPLHAGLREYTLVACAGNASLVDTPCQRSSWRLRLGV